MSVDRFARRMSTATPVIAATASLMCAFSALAGPDWVEGKNDAGSTFLTAQRTFGVGQLTTISGTLSGPATTFLGAGDDFEDLYLVTVTDPSKFSMTVKNIDFAAQIWVFNITLAGELFGLLANADGGDGFPLVTQFATDGTGAALTQPGVYAIGISGAGRIPVSNNGAIFNFGSPTEISGADGPGGLLPLSGWTGDGEFGSYIIELEGVGFFDVPAPGAIALLGLSGLAGRGRRRSG